MSKILIVEDEEAIADLEKDYLELNDFEVKIENSGDTGLATALAEDFDLIILDLMLPGIDGFEICKRIREEKDVPILMVSAKKDDIDKIRGLGLGADDYLTKPFSPSELVARVNTWLGFSARKVRRSNSLVVNVFSTPFTNTLLAVLSILIPLISTMSFSFVCVPTRRL